MEEGKGERYLASGRQYGNALLGVRHHEEEVYYINADIRASNEKNDDRSNLSPEQFANSKQ